MTTQEQINMLMRELERIDTQHVNERANVVARIAALQAALRTESATNGEGPQLLNE